MADDANDGDASEEEERAPTANNAAFHREYVIDVYETLADIR